MSSWKEDANARREARQSPTSDKVRVPPKRNAKKPYWIQRYHEPFVIRGGWIRGGWWMWGRYRTKRAWDEAWRSVVKEAKLAAQEDRFFAECEYRRGADK